MYEEVRQIPLKAVLSAFGFNEWKERKGGTEFYGKCPIHRGENNTAFSYDSSGRFNCFVCSSKGRGAIDLTKAIKQVGFKEAISILSQLELQAVPTSQPTTTVPLVTENAPYKSSYEKFKVESEWLKARGISQEAQDYFGVFEYNNPNRKSAYSGHILFPIKRFSDGQIVGYLARNPKPVQEPQDGQHQVRLQPKYLWPKGVAKSLEVFGSHELKQTLRQLQVQAKLKVCHLVESPLCVMKFWMRGLAAVSPYGWSLSVQQAEILTHLATSWIVLPDKNKRAESLQSVVPLLAQHCFVKAPDYQGEDPEETY